MHDDDVERRLTLSELDATIEDTATQLAELTECMTQLRHHMAELRRVRQAVAETLSTRTQLVEGRMPRSAKPGN